MTTYLYRICTYSKHLFTQLTVTNIKQPGPTNTFSIHQFVSTDCRHPLGDLPESRLTGKLEINVCAGTLFCQLLLL